jgi:hypothetical protein
MRFSSWWYWNDTILDTWEQRFMLACHELAHTVGLRHNLDSTATCVSDDPWGTLPRTLIAHDRDHINQTY